jgi:asparagine synthase (glutamine-hydrolysing)
MAMAHGVESRSPFLDYRVIEYCNRLPCSMKLRGLNDKYLLRRLGARLLPPEIASRPKRPYRAPIHSSLCSSPVPDYVTELLSPNRIKRAGLFRPASVAALLARVMNGARLGETDDMALAGIVSTQLLHDQFVSRRRRAEPLSTQECQVFHPEQSRVTVGGQ